MRKNLVIYRFLLAASFAAAEYSLAQGTGAAAQHSEVDLRIVKSQLETFQGLLNRNIQQSFEQPFALLQDAKGTYLPNFGVAVHLEVNLNTLRLLSPFDMRPYTAEELKKARESKLERIRELKKLLGRFLLEHGALLEAVRPEQNIAIIVHLFNLPSEQSEDLPTQVILEINRQMLLESKIQRLTAEDFEKKVTFLAF
ncbi:MAG: hypothetical protein HY647_09975 [Acidobacteria bacterium]|nr:hypothetical protein [Acidobacteriota bacterium]